MWCGCGGGGGGSDVRGILRGSQWKQECLVDTWAPLMEINAAFCQAKSEQPSLGSWAAWHGAGRLWGAFNDASLHRTSNQFIEAVMYVSQGKSLIKGAKKGIGGCLKCRRTKGVKLAGYIHNCSFPSIFQHSSSLFSLNRSTTLTLSLPPLFTGNWLYSWSTEPASNSPKRHIHHV